MSLQRQNVANVGANCPIPLICLLCTGHQPLPLGGTLFALPSAITQDFKQLLATIFFSSDCYLTSTIIFCRWPCYLEDFSMLKRQALPISYFDKELTVKTAQKLRERFLKCAYHHAYGPTEATCFFVGSCYYR